MLKPREIHMPIGFINKFINVLIISAIVILTYYLSLKFVYPGYFEPLTPHHEDFYWFYSGSPLINFGDLYKTARPVFFLLANFVSMLGLKLGIVFMIILTLINIILTILCVRAISGKISYLMTAIYSTMVFMSPYFYFNYTYMITDTYAYFFLLLIIYFWYKYKNDLNIPKILLISLFIFLCFFSKESFFVTVVLFFIFQFIFEKKLRKYSSSLILISLIGILLVVIQSRLINGVWVNLGNTSDSPYFVNMDPGSIISTYLYYIQGIANIYNIVILALSLTILICTKKYIRESIMLLACGLSVYIPYSLIPNHKEIYYLFLGVPLLCAVILFLSADVFSEFKTKIFNKFKYNNKYAFLLIALVFITLTFFKVVNLSKGDDYRPYNYGWYLQIESSNRNILNSFEKIKQELSAQNNDNILILGLDSFNTLYQSPFSPNGKGVQFIDNYFGNKNINWTIAFYYNEAPWWIKINKDIRSRDGNIFHYINISEIDPKNYKMVITYDQNGKLVNKE